MVIQLGTYTFAGNSCWEHYVSVSSVYAWSCTKSLLQTTCRNFTKCEIYICDAADDKEEL